VSNYMTVLFYCLLANCISPYSFAWLELVSHRSFMPKLLMCNSQKGWPFFQRLLIDLFKFMEPYLRNAELGQPVSLVLVLSCTSLYIGCCFLIFCTFCFVDSPFIQRNLESATCATARLP
jgi:hypothetical protein